ncbi:MAG: hypothetical protein MJ252_23910 [archaeon]|nr:hypothetical protein [archaeon]
MEMLDGEPIPNYYDYFKKGIAEYFIAREFDNKKTVYCFKCRRAFPTPKDHTIHKAYLKSNYYKYDKKPFEKLQEDIKEFQEATRNSKDKYIKDLDYSIGNFITALEKIREDKKKDYETQFEFLDKALTELNQNVENTKKEIQEYFTMFKKFYNVNDKNQDKENTLFLMHFDIMQDYFKENQNYHNELNRLRQLLKDFPVKIEADINKDLEGIKQFLSLGLPDKFFDDFYEKPNTKLAKYIKHNNDFIKTITEIQNTKGDLKKVNDLVKIFDSKTIRGVDYLYSQPYFLEGLNKNTSSAKLNNNPNTIEARPNTSLRSAKKDLNGNNPSPNDNISNCSSKRNLLSNRSLSSKRLSKKSLGKSASNLYDLKPVDEYALGKGQLYKIGEEDVVLSKEFLQRYFYYSIMNFYNQNFAPHPEGDGMKNSKYLLADYSKRQAMLKEYKKPIIGTNRISMYNPKNNKITQIEVPLTKSENGYSEFPDGCRAICIDEIIYITGGKDKMGNPLKFMNMIDLKRKELKTLPSMIVPHAYHNIDFLFNYECILVVGGDDYNDNVEMYDLSTKKWSLLPPITYPRINASLVYDSFASNVYLMFGTLDNKENSTAVEVLPLTDLKTGWVTMNYTKDALIDVKVYYCKVKIFMKDKFLIYGVNESRVDGKSYAIYLVPTNDICRVDNPEDLKEIRKYEKLGLNRSSSNSSLNVSMSGASVHKLSNMSRSASFYNSEKKKNRTISATKAPSSIGGKNSGNRSSSSLKAVK